MLECIPKNREASIVCCLFSLIYLLHVVFLSSCFTVCINGWMDDLRFYVLFNSISVISGRWADDNERLCAMEPRLRLRRFRLERGSNSGPLDQ